MSAWNAKYLPHTARIILGLVFTILGLNGFFNFMSMPAMPEPAGAFMAALGATGYMMTLIKLVEVIGGVLLLLNRFVPLALAILAPGIVNIALFHVFLAPGGLPIAILLLLLEGYLAWSYRDVYRPMLSARPLPTEQKNPTERHRFDHTAEVRG